MGKDRTRKGSNASNVAAQLSEVDAAAEQRLTRCHALAVDEVADLLETSPVSGLSPAEAARRLDVYGPNQLRKSEGVKFYMLVVRHLFNFMSFVLFAAFVMACVTQQWIDAGVVAFLIFINTIIGVSQGTRCSQASVACTLSAHTSSLPLPNRVQVGEDDGGAEEDGVAHVVGHSRPGRQRRRDLVERDRAGRPGPPQPGRPHSRRYTAQLYCHCPCPPARCKKVATRANLVEGQI